MSGKWKFLHRSEDYIFYYRRAIPDSLREAFSRKWEVKHSLRTRDSSLAILRHNALNVKVERLFMQARVGVPVSKKDLSSMLATLEDSKVAVAKYENDPRPATWSGVALLLRGKPLLDENNAIIRPFPVSLDGDKLIAPNGDTISPMDISIALSIADKQKTKELDVDVEQALSPFNGFHFFEMKGDDMQPLTPLPKGQADTMTQTNTVQSPVEPIAPPVQQASENVRAGGLVPVRFSTMCNDYLHSRVSLKERTKQDFKAIFEIFLELNGDIMSTEFNHPLMTKFLNNVRKLPTNMKKRYANTPIKELLEMDIPDDDRMSPTNVNKYMGRLGQLCKWAVNHGFMDRNYADGKRVESTRKEKKKRKRFPFTYEDLASLFNSEIHSEHKRDGKYTEMFWVPLIALYSGMRMEEICQLQVSDICEIEDERTGAKAWCFDINENGHDKSLKNIPSERLVPIHSELVKMGFMSYYHERRRKGFKTLWSLEPAKSGKTLRGYSHNFGKRLSRYMKRHAGIDEQGKTFHSFRHTAIKALRENPDVREDYMRAMVGHELVGTTGKDYFAGLGVAVLKSTVEGIQYPRLDLSHLYQTDGE